MFAPVEDQAKIGEVAARYGVSQPYCLHVGTLQPRKNLAMLIESWARLRGKVRNPPQLLLAGKRGWLYTSLFEAVQSRELGDQVEQVRGRRARWNGVGGATGGATGFRLR